MDLCLILDAFAQRVWEAEVMVVKGRSAPRTAKYEFKREMNADESPLVRLERLSVTSQSAVQGHQEGWYFWYRWDTVMFLVRVIEQIIPDETQTGSNPRTTFPS